jgi:hypothetical protein
MNELSQINTSAMTHLGEVAVYNGQIAEAFKLFNDGSKYVAVPINATAIKSISNDSTDIMNQMKIKAIICCIENLFGPIHVWAVNNRKREFVIARFIFYWSARNCTSYTLDKLSNLLPVKFNHANVIHANSKINDAIKINDPIVISRLEIIASAIAELGDKRLIKHIALIRESNSISDSKKLMKENREVLQ